MAVGFYNNWENIFAELENLFQREFGYQLKTYRVSSDNIKDNQYVKLIPVSSENLEYHKDTEMREYKITFELHYLNKNIKKQQLDQITNYISRIESFVEGNPSMGLGDATKAHDCKIDNVEINTDNENEYIVLMDFSCVHNNNIVTDVSRPRMTISSLSISSGDTSLVSSIPLTFTSNEATTTFTSSDVTIVNGTIGDTFAATSSTVYTATLTPTGAGTITVNVGAGAYRDIAGNDNFAASQFSWVYPNYSVKFDGTDDNLQRDNLVDTFEDTSFSIATWIKIRADLGGGTGGDTYFQQGQNSDGNGIRLGVTLQGRPSASFLGAGNGLESGSENSITAGNWYHIVTTFNLSTKSLKIYLNGSLHGSMTTTDAPTDLNTGAQGMFLGSNRGTNSGVIDGFMDEFAVWTTELSADAVADIYTTGASVDLTSATGDYTAQGSLKVYYKMNEGTGTVVQDSTSNDLDIDFNSGDPTWAVGRL